MISPTCECGSGKLWEWAEDKQSTVCEDCKPKCKTCGDTEFFCTYDPSGDKSRVDPCPDCKTKED